MQKLLSFAPFNLRLHLLENSVHLEREPGQGEEGHHHHQHLDDLLLVVHDDGVPLELGCSRSLGAPECDGHPTRLIVRQIKLLEVR